MSTRWTARISFLPLLAAFVLLAPLAISAEEDPVAEEEAFVPPQIILSTQKQPVYPPAAWDARYSGSVLIEMTVLKDGSVGDVNVVACSRPKVGFEDAATEAVRQWRFEPGILDGEPIDVATRLKLNFARVGVGVNSKPQISAGSFTTERPEPGSFSSSASDSASSSSGGADVK